MISNEELLRTFLPEWLFDYFDVVKLEWEQESLHVHLDEKKVVPDGFQSLQLISYGFTDSVVVHSPQYDCITHKSITSAATIK